MLSELQGIIAQRVLLNFRADPAVVAPLIPRPLELSERNGCALLGICLIRFAELRPAGWPRLLGWSPRSMAHRAAVRFAGPSGLEDGVYIFRRDTSDHLVSWLGGRMFPGKQFRAVFVSEESDCRIEFAVRTDQAAADVSFRAVKAGHWAVQSRLFDSLEAATACLARVECGFSRTRVHDSLEGVRLRIGECKARPLALETLRSSFFEDFRRFPPGSIEPDHALMMENIPHRWSLVERPFTPRWDGPSDATAISPRRRRPYLRFFDI